MYLCIIISCEWSERVRHSTAKVGRAVSWNIATMLNCFSHIWELFITLGEWYNKNAKIESTLHMLLLIFKLIATRYNTVFTNSPVHHRNLNFLDLKSDPVKVKRIEHKGVNRSKICEMFYKFDYIVLHYENKWTVYVPTNF